MRTMVGAKEWFAGWKPRDRTDASMLALIVMCLAAMAVIVAYAAAKHPRDFTLLTVGGLGGWLLLYRVISRWGR